jgi:murein DD-endopeptidase MepM/ murein hydrolase activator NlpD
LHSPSAVAARVLRTLFGNDSSAASGLERDPRSYLANAIRSAAAPVSGSAAELLGGDPSRLARHFDLNRTRAALAAVRARAASFERPERFVPIAVCGLLIGAALVSSIPASSPTQAAEGPSRAPRVVVAGLVAGPAATAPTASGAYTGDGSLGNTLSDPNVASRSLVVNYTVRNGDSLHSIAAKFGLTTTTVYWANKPKLPNPASIRAGLVLQIPAFDGVVVVVKASDTLEALAARWEVTVGDIVDADNLMSPILSVGQVLVIPGVAAGPMPLPPTPAPVQIAKGGGGGSTSCKSCGPTTYPGGSFVWPVLGRSYISQGYWSGHHALDIASSYGNPVVAAAPGTVIFAGWRSYSGGGNVIWISHGSGLYTTYNHLSAWSVKAGQTVSAGQRIGSIGTSGMATGPHLHFEVWTGYPWGNGTDSDAVNPCRYLAGC